MWMRRSWRRPSKWSYVICPSTPWASASDLGNTVCVDRNNRPTQKSRTARARRRPEKLNPCRSGALLVLNHNRIRGTHGERDLPRLRVGGGSAPADCDVERFPTRSVPFT